MMKLNYDLTLEGEALYYENIHIWLDFFVNLGMPCLIAYNKETRTIKEITFEAPTTEAFQGFKKIDKLLEGNK